MAFVKKYILTSEVFFHLLIFLAWGSMLLAYMRGFVGMLPVIGNYQLETEAVVVTCIIIAALPSVINRMATIDWLFLFGCLCIYTLHIGIYFNNYDALIEKMFPTLCLAIPFFIIGRTIDIKLYIAPMTAISTLCIVLDAFYFLIYMRNPAKMAERMAGEYYMYQAYRLLPHVMFMFWQGIRMASVWKILLGILGFFLIIAYGTRGPLGCLGAFCLVYFFFYTKFRFSFIIKSILISLGGIVVLFPQTILLFLEKILSSLDMSTRIVERMLGGGLFHDTGRGFIKMKLYEYLDRPNTFWGYGLFGCSRFGMKYPHDYILDFIFSFGYMLGSIILIILSYIMLKAYIVCESKLERGFMLLLASCTLLKYNFSSTYISEGLYFVLLGFCTTMLIKHRQSNSSLPEKVISEKTQ